MVGAVRANDQGHDQDLEQQLSTATFADSCCSRRCEIDFCTCLGKLFGHGEDLKMAQGVSFILACAFLYGLTAFLFRDQIKS
jgi:hypothetical protein